NQTEIRMGANGEAEPPARTQGRADFVSRDVDIRRQRICRHQPDSFRLQAGTRSGTVGTSTSSDSSRLAVAQTLLAAIMRYRAGGAQITMASNHDDQQLARFIAVFASACDGHARSTGRRLQSQKGQSQR